MDEPNRTIHPSGELGLNKDASATAIGFSNSSDHKRISNILDKNGLPHIDNHEGKLNMRESAQSMKPFNETGASFMSPISGS